MAPWHLGRRAGCWETELAGVSVSVTGRGAGGLGTETGAETGAETGTVTGRGALRQAFRH